MNGPLLQEESYLSREGPWLSPALPSSILREEGMPKRIEYFPHRAFLPLAMVPGSDKRFSLVVLKQVRPKTPSFKKK